MSEGYANLAQELAERPYLIMVSRDETTDGSPVFVARTLEIDNCFGQGDSPEDAINDLRGALLDFIDGLLEDGLPVPQPARLVKTRGTTSSATVSVSNQEVREKYISIQDTYLLTIHA